MPTLYNRIQSRNLERLAALSDGIFAVASSTSTPRRPLRSIPNANFYGRSALWARSGSPTA
ncbi:MAG TPA: hypothetical protein VF865_06130 [Acidobacteriaceae bacterium]